MALHGDDYYYYYYYVLLLFFARTSSYTALPTYLPTYLGTYMIFQIYFFLRICFPTSHEPEVMVTVYSCR